MIMCIV